MWQRGRNLAWLVLAFVGAVDAWAADGLELSVEDWAYGEFRGGPFALSIDVTAEPVTASVSLAWLEGLALGRLDGISAICAELQWDGRSARCDGANVEIDAVPDIGPLTLAGDVTWERGTNAVTVNLDLEGLNAPTRLRGQVSPTVDLRVEVDAFPIGSALPGLAGGALVGFTLADSSTLNLKMHVTDTAGGPRLRGTWQLMGLSFDSDDGTVAAANLSVDGHVDATLGENNLPFVVSLRPRSGEVLFDTFYAAFDREWELRLAARGTLTDSELALDEFSISDAHSLNVKGSARIGGLSDTPTVVDLSAPLVHLKFPAVRTRYLQGVVGALGAAAVHLEGEVWATLDFSSERLQRWSVMTQRLQVDDDSDRLSLTDVNANWQWQREAHELDASIEWGGGALYTMPLGPAKSRWRHSGDALRLLAPTRLPLLDGALVIQRLEARDLNDEQPDLAFEGAVEPLSLSRLSTAFGWPALGGTLSGEVPGVELNDGVLRMQGTLRANVFDGIVRLGRVELERAFGVAPSLAAELEIDGIDLEALTGAFEFGKITGRLDGYAKGLRLVNWQPVAFDAAVQTPRDDRSRRKISQRAIDSLSSIGGGPAGAVSRTFLGFFDEFSYRRLGLSCVLANGVCDMGGVGAAGDRGYYIVQGSGLPRIDVVGYQGRVDWRALVSRLRAATSGAGPVIGG